MFACLSEDILRQIYAYDGTYKEMYKRIVADAFDAVETRALKTYLHGHIHFPMMDMGEWLSMQSFVEGREKYHVVSYPTATMIFHVMSLDRKKRFDDPSDPESPMLVKNILHTLPTRVMNPTMRALDEMRRFITHTTMCDTLTLHPKVYEHIVYHLKLQGRYEEEIHRYLFYDLAWSYTGMMYDDEQANSYNYVHYQGKQYMISWYEC